MQFYADSKYDNEILNLFKKIHFDLLCALIICIQGVKGMLHVTHVPSS